MSKQIQVQILDQPYSLVAKEDEEQLLLQAVANVDAAMQQIHRQGKLKSREKIAVLVAVQIAFDTLLQPKQQLNSSNLDDNYKDRQMELKLEALDIKLEQILRKNTSELF